MVDILRLAFMSVLLVVVTLAAALLQPDLAHDLGLHHWNLTVVKKQLLGDRKTLEEMKELDEQDRAIQRRIARKAAIVKELAAGRWTLFEAAAIFQRLNQDNGGRIYRIQPFGVSEEETICRQVIQWVGVEARAESVSVSEELVQDFEEQLRQHKERYGTVILPEAPTY